MARILAYTSPARGHLFPLTAILEELGRRGHTIALRTLESEVEMAMERGFDAARIDRRIEAIVHDDWRARTPQGAIKRGLGVFSARAAFDAPDLSRAIADAKADAVIVDINSWGAMAAAEAWGGPWATFCPYPLPITSSDAPPFGPGFPPARGPVGRLRDRALQPLMVGSYERAILPAVNGVRRGLGLSALVSANEVFTRAPLVLYLTAEPFEYPRSDWPPSIVMVGPCAWEPPWIGRSGSMGSSGRSCS